MAVCDLCNVPGTGTYISAEQMRKAVFQKSFNPFSSGCIPNIGAMFGQSSATMYEGWKGLVAQDSSDWNICSSCMSKLRRHLPGEARPAGVKTSSVSFDPMVVAAASASASRRYDSSPRIAQSSACSSPTVSDVVDQAPRKTRARTVFGALAAVVMAVVLFLAVGCGDEDSGGTCDSTSACGMCYYLCNTSGGNSMHGYDNTPYTECGCINTAKGDCGYLGLNQAACASSPPAWFPKK